MPRVAVLVPWRPGCSHRQRAYEIVSSRYRAEHRDWELVEARGPEGPWVKANAVMPAARELDDRVDVVVVADADVWCDGLQLAVDEVLAGAAWAIPHLLVHRLAADGVGIDQPPYPGMPGGGLLALPRQVLLDIPLDPRFQGWGQEDECWAFALETLLGPCWRGTADLTHLWHPPQERLSRTRGSQDSWRLRKRYARARQDPRAMRALISEAHSALRPSHPHRHDHPPQLVR